MRRDLAPGEVLRVSAGSLVAFATTVDYGITTAGGLKNIVFGTDGVFLATLTGPGAVFLQVQSIMILYFHKVLEPHTFNVRNRRVACAVAGYSSSAAG
jgi:uncharacterized protein (AIM24 family)